MNSLSAIFNVIISPKQAFAALKERPYILVIMVLTALITGVVTFAIMSHLDPVTVRTEIREQIQEFKSKIESQTGQSLTDEKIDEMVDKRAEGMSKWTVISSFVAPVTSVIMYLILALIFFLLFKLLDTELSYKQSFSLILHCYIPHLIKAILAVVIAMVKGSYGMMELQNLVASNPGALVDPKTQKVLHTLLTSLDLFNVWVVVLMILGFGIVSDKKPSRVAPWIIGLWILWIVVKVGATAVLGSVFGS